MHWGFPFRIDSRGRTATAKDSEYVRQLLEQVLFTAHGERVMRPTFGTGVHHLVFAPNRDQLARSVESLVKANLEEWLGGQVRIESLDVEVEDSQLTVALVYRWLLDGSLDQIILSRVVGG